MSAIAAKYGGGGHQKAAGCSLTEEAYKQYVVATFHIEPIPEDAKRNRYNVKGSTFGTFYKNQQDEMFMLYSNDEVDWIIEKNNMLLTQSFASFNEAEWFLKRNKQVWLVRDDLFVDYLMREVNKGRHLHKGM